MTKKVRLYNPQRKMTNYRYQTKQLNLLIEELLKQDASDTAKTNHSAFVILAILAGVAFLIVIGSVILLKGG